MKKLILKLSIITIIIFILMPLKNSYAAEASLSASNAVVGGTINATISIPDGARGYSAVISIIYSDGTTSSQNIGAGNTVGNLTPEQLTRTVSFPAKVIGNATIKLSNISISDSDRNPMNSNTTLSTNVQIQDNSTPEPTEEPEEPKEPEEPEEPEETPTPTKEPEPTFTSVNDTVYVKKKVNVRESYTTSSKSYGLLDVGTELTRLGIGDNGWTKVRYDGGIAYISSGFLTTEKPQETPEETPTPSPSPSESPDITPSPTPEEDEESKNKKNYEKIVKEVGVLPEVGNNIAKYLYVSMICISCIGIIIINKIFKE